MVCLLLLSFVLPLPLLLCSFVIDGHGRRPHSLIYPASAENGFSSTVTSLLMSSPTSLARNSRYSSASYSSSSFVFSRGINRSSPSSSSSSSLGPETAVWNAEIVSLRRAACSSVCVGSAGTGEGERGVRVERGVEHVLAHEEGFRCLAVRC